MATVVKVILTVPKCLAFVHVHQYITLRRHAPKEWTGVTNQFIGWKGVLSRDSLNASSHVENWSEPATIETTHGVTKKCVPFENPQCSSELMKSLLINSCTSCNESQIIGNVDGLIFPDHPWVQSSSNFRHIMLAEKRNLKWYVCVKKNSTGASTPGVEQSS